MAPSTPLPLPFSSQAHPSTNASQAHPSTGARRGSSSSAHAIACCALRCACMSADCVMSWLPRPCHGRHSRVGSLWVASRLPPSKLNGIISAQDRRSLYGVSASAADDALAVEWHACRVLLDVGRAYRRSVHARRPFHSGSSRSGDVACLPSEGRCPWSLPRCVRSTPGLPLESAPGILGGTTGESTLLLQAPATPAAGHLSSSNHASSLLPPSAHLVVPLSFSRLLVLVWLSVCSFV